MDPDLLMQLMSDPAMAEQLAAMGVYGDRQALLGQQTKRADALRGTPSATGAQVGSTYVASSPLEHIGVAMSRLRGERDLAKASGQQQGLVGGDMTARTALAKAMADAMRKRNPAAASATVGQPMGGPMAGGYGTTLND